MKPSVSAFIGTDACSAADAGIRLKIAGFSDGILSGSIVATHTAMPASLLVTADGRSIGDALVTWSDAGSGKGIWSFDAKVLPPDLLLEDRVWLAVMLPGQSIELDARDIDPRRFPSPAGPAQPRGALEGYVDGTENGIVRGWVRDTADAGRRVALQLYIDERFCGTYIANRRRPDLLAIGRGDGRYGFSIPAQAFLAQATSPRPRVHVVAGGEGWVVPSAPHLEPRRRRLAMPRLRDIPATTQELVALLASTEPFPKKTFVIDRLTRMPEAFSADYVLLAIEHLRVEMLKAPASAPSSWRDFVVAWWRQRLMRAQIRRLSALADAAAASQSLLDTMARDTAAPRETSRP